MEKLCFSESYLPNVISGVAIEIKKNKPWLYKTNGS